MKGRPPVVPVVVVAAVAVLAVVAAVVAANRSTPTYGPGTATGVAQRYLAAVVDGDHAAAARLLAADGPCTIDDLDRSGVPDGVRVVLLGTRVAADTAQVDVDVATPSGGPFGGSEDTEKRTLRLVRVAGDWRVTGEPWPMSDCGTEV